MPFTAAAPARLTFAALAALIVAGAATPRVAPAAPADKGAALEPYAIDPNHSAIQFTVRHFFSRVPGRFTKFEGAVLLDEKDLAKGSVSVTIDAASIDTGEPARDKHLRSDDFFAVEKHPKITFQSTAVKPAGPGKLKVEGNLTIRGVTRPVTLEVDVLGFGQGYGGRTGGFEARTRVDRTVFGVSWNDVVEGGGAVLSNEVDIVINLEVQKKAPKPAA
jgi:polyisoprenoid-binding protein YceI